MAEKANGFDLQIKKKTGGGNWATIKGIKELNIPALQKDTIDLTNFDQSVRSYMGGMIDYGELSFKTDFYPSHFHYSLFPNDDISYQNTVNDSVDVNGTFDDTDEGGVGDTGWLSDGGGGFSIVSGAAHLDLADDTDDPTYLLRTNTGGSPVSRGSVYSAFYVVTAKTGTDGQLKWEYSGDLNNNQFYTSANGYQGYRTYFIPSELGFNYTGAIMNDHPSFKFYWAGDSGSSASVTLDSLSLYKLYSWQDLFLNDIELECRVKDSNGTIRFTFDAFITNCDVQSPIDGVIEHDLTLKVNGAVTYG